MPGAGVLSEVTYSGGATGPVGPRELSGSRGRPGASYGLLPVMEFVPPNLRPPGRSWDGGWSEPTGSLSDRIPLWDAIRRLFLTVVGEIPSWRPGGFDQSRKKRAAYSQLLPFRDSYAKRAGAGRYNWQPQVKIQAPSQPHVTY